MPGYRVGLTGGIGSGKSTIAAMFADHGAGLVDADALVHEATAPGGSAIPALREAFGPAAIGPDGGLDRPRMRTRVFTDRRERHKLESVLHPLVRAEAARRAALLSAHVPYVVLVVPLLVESGDWTARVHRVLVVDCSETTQLARVSARPGLDRITAEAIVAAQAGRGQRLDAADDVLFNEAAFQDIAARVECLHRMYLVRAAERAPAGGL